MPIYIGGNRIKNMFDTFSEAYIDEALLDLIQGTLPDDGSTVPDSPTPDIHIDEYRNINRIISNINLILGNCNLSITNNSISELNDTLIKAKIVLKDVVEILAELIEYNSVNSSTSEDSANINQTISSINQILGYDNLNTNNTSVSDLENTLINAKMIIESITEDLVDINGTTLFKRDEQIQG